MTVALSAAGHTAADAQLPAEGRDALPAAPETVRFQPNAKSPVVEFEIPATMQRHDIAELARKNDRSVFKSFDVRGGSNTAYIGAGAKVGSVAVQILGHRNRIFIGEGCLLKGVIGIRGSDQTVVIGARTTFNNVAIVCKYQDVFIGRDCMFSSGIEVRTSDSHGVIDLERMVVANSAEGVYIGDHVWVGKDAVVQKGAYIAEDNIIAMSAFVRGAFPDSSSIIAGTPAKVVRTARSWARDELVDPKTTDIYAWRTYPLL